MKSTLLNMVLSLLGITFVASAGVGIVNQITKEPIAQATQAATTAALEQVLPKFDAITDEMLTLDDMPIKVYTAKGGSDAVGYAVETMTKSGFSGVVKLMVGFTPDGKVYNVNVLAQNETPGLGTKMADDGNPLLMSVKDKVLSDLDLRVTKDGGDIDALTAATISSRAYADAMKRALVAFETVTKRGGNNE
ncbi:MAG: RnfABCDGE type electron transport complex subunit G [Rikenellaceae bacterium]